MKSIEEVERLIELVMMDDITFKEALKLVDSFDREPGRSDGAVE